MTKEKSTKSAAHPSTESADKEELSEGFHRYYKAVYQSDENVSAVLNCHLVAEYYMEQIIMASLPRGDILFSGKNKPGFGSKLQLLQALDVAEDELITSLRSLNQVRNSCSHELDYQITRNDIEKIGRSWGKQHIETRRECGDDTNKFLRWTLMAPLARLETIFEDLIEKDS